MESLCTQNEGRLARREAINFRAELVTFCAQRTWNRRGVRETRKIALVVGESLASSELWPQEAPAVERRIGLLVHVQVKQVWRHRPARGIRKGGVLSSKRVG